MRMTLSRRVSLATMLLAAVTVTTLAARQITPKAPPSTEIGGPGFNPTMPPLNTAGYALARPLGVTRAVYEFAARHPEVTRYVPCYCGCEADGHRANEACFIGARDAKGNVTAWDTHGFGCAVCVDVARESMQLFNSGADPASIRSAIERKWTPQYSTKTPTPPVPAKKR
jgi:hypothetical protein